MTIKLTEYGVRYLGCKRDNCPDFIEENSMCRREKCNRLHTEIRIPEEEFG